MDESCLAAIRAELGELGRTWTPADVAEVMRRQQLVVSDAALLQTVADLRRTSSGAGPLQPLLQLPGVTDVLVNGPNQVFVDVGGTLELTDVTFADDEQVRRLATRLAAGAGRRLDDASPCVDARLQDGTRLHAVLAPVSEPGTCISLRVPAQGGISLEQWVRCGSVDPQVAELLAEIVSARVAFLISGGTGSGKTTLLAALLGLIDPQQRIVVVEDSKELMLDHPHWIRLEARHTNAEGAGGITLTELVRQALRMRPDRLVLGEVRGAELTDLLLALNTGHEGGCGTVHANAPEAVPARLEALAALGGFSRETCHAQVSAALQVVIHLRRGLDGVRRVSQIAVLERTAGVVSAVPAVSQHSAGRPSFGPGFPRLRELVGR